MHTLVILFHPQSFQLLPLLSQIPDLYNILVFTNLTLPSDLFTNICQNVVVSRASIMDEWEIVNSCKDQCMENILVINDVQDAKILVGSGYRIELALTFLKEGNDVVFPEGGQKAFWVRKEAKREKECYIFKKSMIKKLNIRIGAWYFPQYHKIADNDKFWGEGFTDWTLLKPAENVFPGQELKKPHLDLGYYDLTETATRKFQGELAEKYGISFFCFYHYWFNGHQVMHTPIQLLLEDSYPAVDFILEWANESWIKTWTGNTNQVLIQQDYGDSNSWTRHYEYLSKVFKSKRYIKINGAPIFIIYRMDHIGEKFEPMVKLWKELARKDGFPDLVILGKTNTWNKDDKMASLINQDKLSGFVEFLPTGAHFSQIPTRDNYDINNRKCSTFSMNDVFASSFKFNRKSGIIYRGWYAGWDNTPRCLNRKATKSVDSDIDTFKKYLIQRIKQVLAHPNPPQYHNLIFINAWNEWNEQAILEPNHIDGYAYLETIKSVLEYFN